MNLISQFSSHLKACKTILHLEQVHAHIIRQGLEQDHFIITQFICLCNSLTNLPYATSVFNRVYTPSIYLWNSVIKGYCESSSFLDTVSVFVRMKRSEIVPDKYTYPSLIKACSNGGKIREGVVIHGSAVRCGVRRGRVCEDEFD
ncbi:hypothetical protein L1049_007618 [Liquidambar formosana]|uniref:Pentatricopeptide repeat-containing protein n=1 Tax=Liquidambar formosana TaxID=63359 RepID=A0AAP0X7N2_LIQFO